jgi:putative ABC transport system permease protein
MMEWFNILMARLRTLFRRESVLRDIEEELRVHVEMETETNIKRGMPPDEARAAALKSFGDLGRNIEHGYDIRGGGWLETLWQDLRYSVRTLAKTPGFTATALITLALCIGANLTIFAIVDAVLLRPLPVPEADRLVTIFNTYPKAGVERDGSSFTNYYERRGKIAAFSELAICREGTAVIGEASATQREPVMLVSPEFFSTLGIGPIIGRSFTEEELTFQTDGVAILTDAYWRQYFNADANVIGREIRVDGLQKKVIGVLPPTFRYLSSEAGLYFPLSSNPANRAPGQRHSGNSISMIARLKSGVTITQAQAQIDAHNAALADSYPQAKMIAEAGFRSLVLSLRADHVASIRPTLLLMQAGVLLILLIGGVNLVNLLLIRASGRTKELAIRQSLGASRRRVVSQVLAESILLTLTGGLFGLAIAAGGIRLLTVLGADQLPLGAQIAFDGRLTLTALAGAVVIGIVIGLPIAAFNLRARVANALQSESRSGTTNRAAQRLRHSFIVAQLALAFVLLSGAGLLSLSLKRVMAVSPGFRSEHVLSGQISLPWKTYATTPARLGFVERLMEEVRHQPGVTAAGVITNIPLSRSNGKTAITPKGYASRPGESVRGHYFYGVAGDYFAALSIPLREGRFLDSADLRRTERVCVVDEDFARRYWPQGGALGQQVFLSSKQEADSEAITIVGVVGAVKQAALTEDQASGAVYYPYNNRFDDRLFVVVRTTTLPESLGATLQTIVRKIDAELPVNDLRTMDNRIADSLVARRSSALLIGLFAGVALLLTAIGTYGVLSYAVSQRHREIGIRIALGALPSQIRQQFLSLGLRLLVVGAAIGVLGAGLAGWVMRAILFNIPALHPATLIVTFGILGAVALVACLIPARRAAKVDPMVALRSE